MTEGLRVNFSDKEATSAALDPIPRGEYHVKITDGEIRYSKSEKHNGEPYWALELTVQEGPHENRKVWSNVMLFDGALYSLSQLMKALGYNIEAGDFVVPPIDDLITKDLIVRVTIRPETDQYQAQNEVKAYKAWGDAPKSGGGGKTNALLP
jgi:hypothetical protein